MTSPDTSGRPHRAPRPLDELTRSAERHHVWRSADGEPLLAVVVRRRDDGEKDPWCARPEGSGWVPGQPERPPAGWPLYRLPDLMDADPSRTVWVAEGENDADTLAALGLVATTSLGGAGKARSMDWSPLAGRCVVVLPDHDVQGRDHAEAVARCARAAGAVDVLVLPLPGEKWGDDLPKGHGQDVSDWLAKGNTIDDLLDAMASAEPVDPLEAVLRASPRLMRGSGWGDPRPVDWVVPDLVPAGAFVLLVGQPGSGKSLVALDWAASAAGAGLALYVVGEGSGGFAGRREGWRRAHGEDLPDELLFWNGAVQVAEAAALDELIDAINAAAAALGRRPRLIVLDTLARCTLGMDENSASDASLFAAAVKRLQETGAAVVVLHHPDKAGHGPRGSGAFHAAADATIHIEASGMTHALNVRKSKDGGREDWSVEYHRHVVDLGLGEDGNPVTVVAVVRGRTRPAGVQSPPATRTGTLTRNRRAVLETIAALDAEGEPATMAAVVRRSGLPKSSVAETLGWARDCGAVEGGQGASYRPGPDWPAAVARVVRSGPDWSDSGPTGPAVLGPVRSGGPIRDPGSDQPDRSADPDAAGHVGELRDKGAA